MVNKETLDLFTIIYDAAYHCIIYIHYFEIVNKDIEDRKNKNKECIFWFAVNNTFADEACLYWAKIFGSYKEPTHYTKFFNREDIITKEYSRKVVHERILAIVCYDEKKYKEFHKNVLKCRNKLIAHTEINARFVYPDLIVCRKMAEELLVIFKELLEKWLPEDKYKNFWFLDGLTDELNILHCYKERSHHKLYEICLQAYNERDD